MISARAPLTSQFGVELGGGLETQVVPLVIVTSRRSVPNPAAWRRRVVSSSRAFRRCAFACARRIFLLSPLLIPSFLEELSSDSGSESYSDSDPYSSSSVSYSE